ncbi:MAG TPA: FIST C-terminal domain-containing protein [Rhodocyclaceae bacterium]|nr:FIST C-terminal domain-containing protein [Rhodocyclaceae bacterium]
MAATGFATGGAATPDLAVAAVRQALEAVGEKLAGSVLLFLTPHFARNAQGAVTAAAKAARCLQVAGCTAPGVFTDRGWSLDQPAAAALVLTGGIGIGHAVGAEPTLTLATPAAGHLLNDDHPSRFGLISTDTDGARNGRVWLGAKVLRQGFCEASFEGARLAAGASRGMQLLSDQLEVTDVDGHEIFELEGQPALAGLRASLPPVPDDVPLPPVSHLFALVPDQSIDIRQAFREGRYGLLPVVGINADEQSVTLAMPLPPGERILWALRQPAAAERDTAALLDRLAGPVADPAFALLFACIGRGPYFFGGEDRDRAALCERYPGLPVIGAYGGGEIAPLPGGSALINYSAVCVLVGSDVQS